MPKQMQSRDYVISGRFPPNSYPQHVSLGVVTGLEVTLGPTTVAKAEESKAFLGSSRKAVTKDEAAQHVAGILGQVARDEIIPLTVACREAIKKAQLLIKDAKRSIAKDNAKLALETVISHGFEITRLCKEHIKTPSRKVNYCLKLDDDIENRPLVTHPVVVEALKNLRSAHDDYENAANDLAACAAEVSELRQSAEGAKAGNVDDLNDKLAAAQGLVADLPDAAALARYAAELDLMMSQLKRSAAGAV